MTTPLTRWRTSLGFGVHSPFAFRFIREVLRERRCAYYAYTDIAACKKTCIRRNNFISEFFQLLYIILHYRIAVHLCIHCRSNYLLTCTCHHCCRKHIIRNAICNFTDYIC